ncbi:YeaC family protein [Hahella ganghwensis]|uniref:YeaC family protein n=1 Tax=Hahella ganghwensis TaxID=286420 RepID=UPI0003802BAB|nr:DUF1315 family protein [Hahella ganghwensis]
MSFVEVAKNLTPEVYESLKRSLELGRWPDGRSLTTEQKQICMDAVIAYEAANNVPEEQRVGYIARDKPTPCAEKAGNQPASGVWTPGGNDTRH